MTEQENDDTSALAYQLELEGRRWQEEQAKDPGYAEWLSAELAWWRFIDSDPNWIKDHA